MLDVVASFLLGLAFTALCIKLLRNVFVKKARIQTYLDKIWFIFAFILLVGLVLFYVIQPGIFLNFFKVKPELRMLCMALFPVAVLSVGVGLYCFMKGKYVSDTKICRYGAAVTLLGITFGFVLLFFIFYVK
jgi:hypothetical protein